MPASRPNLRTIAKHLGLSVTTVSRALKDGPEVKPGTVAKVKAAAEQIGYQPDARGVMLRTGKTMQVCSILYSPEVGDYGDPGFLAQVESLAQGLEVDRYSLVVLAQTSNKDPLEPVIRVHTQRMADAVVFSRTTSQDSRAKYCLQHDFPFVSFGRTELLTPHAFVDHDDEQAAYDAVKRLIVDGHRKIGMIDPPENLTFFGYRKQGARRAMTEAGLDPESLIWMRSDVSVRAARDATTALFRTQRDATAIVCASQMTMIGALEALMELNMDTIRDGIGVVGFGGMPFRMLSKQKLAYYYQPQRHVGEVLARHLHDLMVGVPAQELQTLLPYRRIDDLAAFREGEDF
ncbi:MAG TPA: LacI family transcriptional regulator [Thalassospira lucentensis]|uniref:LacI family transcriptional regulator n=3 Tax=Thalassospira lucentensis TaxID=168935 RepID=A0A3D5NB47_9PROT|nr:LacI family DNA-binding transcriptional regulator [Thalassospira lucentensis]HCW68639.1 LacI family transcriptional regulator [Thalassospira lucentensis]